MATLAGGETFSKLDLSHAYLQIPLHEESKPLVTINTLQGLYRYNRLPFGVSTAPAIFQRTMENLLRGIPHVTVYIDDILVTGETESEHLQNLEEALQRLETAGMRLKRSKCRFMMNEVEYLGHKISREGLQPAEEKVRAIRSAPTPGNVSQLKSFLGLLNFYSRFLPNLPTTLAPLHHLLQKKSSWIWGAEQQQSFEKAKTLLTSSSLLVHYNPQRELLLSCDASSYGVGAVLSHRMEDGSSQPVAFASRTLAPAEKRYAQVDREGLAIVFGVTKFRQYLLGRQFTIISDHKPLIHLFGHSRAIPPMASARIQRWALILSAYNYTILHRAGKDNADADALSRLPLPECPAEVPLPGETILLHDTLRSTPVTAEEIRRWTDQDATLSRVRNLVLRGWPLSVQEDALRPYFGRRMELSIQSGCIMWGTRVVMPPVGRALVMDELHETHPGVSRIKALARSFVWWPGMDAELETKVRRCEQCQLHQKMPAKAPLHPWDWPERPWVRVHADYAGPFMGKMFLLLVDAHSKWLEIRETTSATTQNTISEMRSIFATHGLPVHLVTDNGPAFTSEEFGVFLKRNGVHHIKSSPYHPASNGLVERAVQTFKTAMKMSGPTQTRLSRFLLQYRITPHTSTGQSPAELLMGRTLRSQLDLMLPSAVQSASQRVQRSQNRQKAVHDSHSSTRARSFAVDDTVSVKNIPGRQPKWIPGQVAEKTGPLSYRVLLDDDRVIRRHIDQIRPREIADSDAEQAAPETPVDGDTWDALPMPPHAASPDAPEDEPSPEPRRSQRVRRPPDRYSPT